MNDEQMEQHMRDLFERGDMEGFAKAQYEMSTEDVVQEWPQSGERIVGAENRRGVYGNFPGLPSIVPREIRCVGDLCVAEATLTYGGESRYESVFVFELSGGRIARETAYWSEPFEAPDWRAQWVELG
jgi:hypothetical protein